MASKTAVGCGPLSRRLSPDVDECALSSSLCPHGRCINVVGAFQCSCDAGFRASPDRQRCVGEAAHTRPTRASPLLPFRPARSCAEAPLLVPSLRTRFYRC